MSDNEDFERFLGEDKYEEHITNPFDDDTDENISPVENPIFAILTKIHL